MAGAQGDGVVVEELTFEVEPEVFDRWLAREAEAWDAFLAGQDGFLGKEVWQAADGDRGTVRVQIWWASRSQWKAIDPGDVEAADRRMGDLLRDSECREYRRVRRI